MRSTEQLARLKRGHNVPRIGQIVPPVIIVVYEGEERLIDGNHRVNHWVAQKSPGTHAVHVHEIVGVISFSPLNP